VNQIFGSEVVVNLTTEKTNSDGKCDDGSDDGDTFEDGLESI
jgi:hypothetical protein